MRQRLVMVGLALCAVAACAAEKPVLLYSRHFNAKGETRYLPDGQYKVLLDRLATDFTVRVHDKPLNLDTLRDVNVLLIANPSDKAVGANPAPPHVDKQAIESVTQFVRRGGGVVIMANQENHNMEVEDTNKLLKQYGLAWTNIYVDAKLLPVPKAAPQIGGLRWAFYTGNLLLLDTNHPAHPRALVANDLNVKPPKGERDAPGVLMATATQGRGRLIAVTDSGWLADWAFDERGVGGVSLKGQDNYEIFRRLALWLATGTFSQGRSKLN
jgi:hypothetical protein